MLLYVLKRFLLAIAIVFVSMVILFSLLHLVPGDPASIALGPRATPELIKAFRERLGLDEPLPVQMWRFFANLLSGDLGVDLWTNASVAQVTLRELPRTCALAAAGLGWAAILGVVLGCFSATRRNSRVDRLLGILSVGAIAMPSFVVAIYALLVFAVWLHWFPAIGAGPPGDLGLQLWHLALPAFALGLGWVGYIARLVRASMIEVLSENHIRTVRAYGLPQRSAAFRRAVHRDRVQPTRNRQAGVRRGDFAQLPGRARGRPHHHDPVCAVHARRRSGGGATRSAVARHALVGPRSK